MQREALDVCLGFVFAWRPWKTRAEELPPSHWNHSCSPTRHVTATNKGPHTVGSALHGSADPRLTGVHACPEPPRVWLLCVPSPSIRWGSTVQGHSAPTLLGLFTGAEEGESVMGAACGVCPACKSLQPNTAAPRSSMSASPPPGSRHPSHQLMEGTLRPQCSIFT